jgi:hypothetical protein
VEVIQIPANNFLLAAERWVRLFVGTPFGM